MIVNKYHGTYNRSWRSGGVGTIKYICIHYTGGTGSARNNCIYFSGGNRNASADYFVDDGGIWEYNDPDEGYYTWAVGDGGGRYGLTNSNSVSIEVVNNGGPFSSREIEYLCELVPYLMAKYHVHPDNVVRHYDASRKQCPYYYVDHGRWHQLWQIITKGDDMPSVEDLWNYNIDGVSARDRLKGVDWAANEARDELKDTSDPTGRGSEATMRYRIAWMAKKQEDQGKAIEDLSAKLDRVLELLAQR